MTNLLSWTSGVALVGAVTIAVYVVSRSRSTATTKLRGPKRESWFFGQTKAKWGDPASLDVLAEWATEYGRVFYRPGPLGSSDLSVVDPRAAAHILNNSEKIYHLHPLARAGLHSLVGKGLFAADGESHKRQKKVISPGFTSVKIREYTSIFFDCAHKLASQWDSELEHSGNFITDMNKWFGAFSIDTMGLASLTHDFGAISGRPSAVDSSFEAIIKAKVGIMDAIVVILQPVLVFLRTFPTARQTAVNDMHAACSDLARKIIARTRAEDKDERSIMGLLIKAHDVSSGVTITEEEVTTHIRTLILAGYETTSAVLTWCIIELCRYPSLQERLRTELLVGFPGSEDPTYDDLTSNLPLLDAFVHEVLRLHPGVPETFRTAQLDDVLPLSEPVILPGGSKTNSIAIGKGTTVSIPIGAINRSKVLWGSDAYEFRPERWLAPLPPGALEISGYRHLLTFSDGPKVCLGRSFIVTNTKALLSVLIRRYVFELPGGPETKIGVKRTITLRPVVEGQDGFSIPVRVRRTD